MPKCYHLERAKDNSFWSEPLDYGSKLQEVIEPAMISAVEPVVVVTIEERFNQVFDSASLCAYTSHGTRALRVGSGEQGSLRRLDSIIDAVRPERSESGAQHPGLAAI